MLTKLLYGKITWWIKSLKIYSVNANIAPKEYLMYYLDIIFVICFQISYCLFVSYIAYILIQYYSTDNLENLEIVDKDDQIYEEMYITD